jgi:hypothetical protein
MVQVTKTIDECIDRCAQQAYNTYMSGSMGSEWQYTSTEAYAWVLGVPHDIFIKKCKMAYTKLFFKKEK